MSDNSHQATDDAIVNARLAEIEARAGEVILPEQLPIVRRSIARSIALARKVRATPMSNADEPEIVFEPWRRTGGRS